MDAVVTLKMSVGELDTIKASLGANVEALTESTKGMPPGKLKSDLIAEAAQAKLLLERLS